MKSKTFTLGFAVYLFILIGASNIRAQTNENYLSLDSYRKMLAADSVDQIERVEWSGIHILGLRVFGRWRSVDRGGTFLGLYTGSYTQYFRLNQDNDTVFRGLGKEDNFMQFLFPTARTRKNVRNIMSSNEKALSLLDTFDQQLGEGETIYMAGKASSLVGEVMFYSGLFFGTATGNTKLLKNLALPGLTVFIVGTIVEIIGIIVEQKAFAFLDDAVERFNN